MIAIHRACNLLVGHNDVVELLTMLGGLTDAEVVGSLAEKHADNLGQVIRGLLKNRQTNLRAVAQLRRLLWLAWALVEANYESDEAALIRLAREQASNPN